MDGSCLIGCAVDIEHWGGACEWSEGQLLHAGKITVDEQTIHATVKECHHTFDLCCVSCLELNFEVQQIWGSSKCNNRVF